MSDLGRGPPTQNPTPTSITHRGDNVVLSRTMFGSIGLFYCSMLFAAVVTKSLKAQEMATLPQTFEQNGVIKQIEHEDLLISIENWLLSQFNLPTINHHPRIELVAPSTIASLGYKKFLSDPSVVAESETIGSQPNTVSLYDDVTQTIYLPKGPDRQRRR